MLIKNKVKKNALQTQQAKIDAKSTVQGSTGEGKYVEGKTPSGHAQDDFERRSASQKWEVWEGREVRNKELQEEKKYMGGKGRVLWGSTLEEGPRAGSEIIFCTINEPYPKFIFAVYRLDQVRAW